MLCLEMNFLDLAVLQDWQRRSNEQEREEQRIDVLFKERPSSSSRHGTGRARAARVHLKSMLPSLKFSSSCSAAEL